MQWIAQALERFSPAQNDGEIFDALVWGAKHLGFEYCEVVVLVDRPGGRLTYFQHHNYPAAFNQLFGDNSRTLLEPLLEKVQRTQLPFVWSETLFSANPEVWQHCQAHGVRLGVTRMVQGLQGVNTLISLCRGEGDVAGGEFYDNVADFMWLTNLVHEALAYRCEHASRQAEPHAVIQPHLSSRELEVLKCASMGMTSELVAIALAVSQRTVNFHIARCIEKLGACNKLSAVVKATQYGLI